MVEKVKKKRGRKPKKKVDPVDKPPPKKRGRKPKGGKIVKKANGSLAIAMEMLFSNDISLEDVNVDIPIPDPDPVNESDNNYNVEESIVQDTGDEEDLEMHGEY